MRRYEFLIWWSMVPILFNVSIVNFSNSTKNLKDLQKITGKPISSEICNVTTHVILKGLRTPINKKKLCICLGNSSKIFTVYGTFSSYENLKNEITKNDSLSIYFNDEMNDENYVEAIQIQKGSNILYSISQWKNKELGSTLVMLLVGILFGSIGFRKYLKFKKDRKVEINSAKIYNYYNEKK